MREAAVQIPDEIISERREMRRVQPTDIESTFFFSKTQLEHDRKIRI